MDPRIPRMSRLANTIRPQNAFMITRPKLVYGPNNSIMIATPSLPKMPENYKNLNKMKTLNNFPSVALNRIRIRNFLTTDRPRLIKFIMYAYYSSFIGQDRNTYRLTGIFHRAIRRLSTLSNNNLNRPIPPRRLYDILIRLNRDTLVKLAKILEW